MVKIKLSTDFSATPGGRLIADGDYSGELFRDTLLLEKYEEAERTNTLLEVDFDDCYGVGTSFLEEAFGGLVRKHHKHGILKRLKIVALEDETIPGNIKKYVEEAEANDISKLNAHFNAYLVKEVN